MNKLLSQALKYVLSQIINNYSVIKKSILFISAVFLVIASHNFFLGMETGKVLAANSSHHQIIARTLKPSTIEQSCDARALQNGILKCKAKAVVEVLGTNYACDNRTNWSVKTKVHLGTKNLILTEGQRQNIQMNGKDIPEISAMPIGSGGSCVSSGNIVTNSYRHLHNGRVTLLTNGSDIPSNLGSKFNHSTASYLQRYLDREKIKLASNEAIYLFEIGQKNRNQPGFDLQDNAVKVSLYKPA